MVASRWVLHVDLDQFLAAVEVRRRPELAGRPVVVGGDGDPTKARQVVATASYEARARGVRSGVPMRRALALCPDAVFLPSDRPAYDAASAEVMAVLRASGEPVEVLGWDEAFVGTDGDPRALAERLRADVREQTGLSCAVGIGDTKPRAKTATGFAKPGGIASLTREDWLPVMGERPTRALWGVGPRSAARLEELGITTVAGLAAADPAALATVFGPSTGPGLVLAGQGRGSATVDPTPWVARSAGHETTYAEDLDGPDALAQAVRVLAAAVAADVAADGRLVERVAVKVRYGPFLTRSRSVPVRPPTRDAATLEQAALLALARFDADRPVRLLGVRADYAQAAATTGTGAGAGPGAPAPPAG
ncbi:DNA polymerase IV, partial [Aquipuribacter hungaricus]|uniref:DNA polymerase IV n=1 Tax=Aquipuribacter hungaricus TaxID=545624 RepID=UPI0030EB40D1